MVQWVCTAVGVPRPAGGYGHPYPPESPLQTHKPELAALAGLADRGKPAECRVRGRQTLGSLRQLGVCGGGAGLSDSGPQAGAWGSGIWGTLADP